MLQSYLEELRKTPLLEPEEEHRLWEQAAKGDLDAHQKLMTSYQPLVFKIAASFNPWSFIWFMSFAGHAAGSTKKHSLDVSSCTR